METPSSTRRITRSQTSAIAASTKKVEDQMEKSSRQQQRSGKKQPQDRSALIDITNDSPIVGLAMGNLETPSSAAMSKRRMIRTPGSGEALLRGQVKTLLQRVEEEAEFSKISVQGNRMVFNLQGLLNNNYSPNMMNICAPTPANTPQLLNFSANGDETLPSVSEEKILISQMVTEMFHGKDQEATVSEASITRSLMLDFIEKSQPSDLSDSSSSVAPHQGGMYADTESSVEKSKDDDDASSIWSIQVNVSSTRDEEEECYEDGLEEECDNLEYEEEEEEEEYKISGAGILLLDELCEGMNKISVNGASNFTGKHVRFTYDSDDELQGEEEVRVVD